MDQFRHTFPSSTIPPKMHMLEDHTMDWVRTRSVSFGLLGEQGPYTHALTVFREHAHQFQGEWKGWGTSWRNTSSASARRMLQQGHHLPKERSLCNKKSSKQKRSPLSTLPPIAIFVYYHPTVPIRHKPASPHPLLLTVLNYWLQAMFNFHAIFQRLVLFVKIHTKQVIVL